MAAAGVISLVVWWLADPTLLEAFGGSLIGIGALSLLAGGLAGGGYVTAGDYGILYGRRHRHGWDSVQAEIGRAQDLRARLQRRLRPAANPSAFWQVIAGLLLVGMGATVLGLT